MSQNQVYCLVWVRMSVRFWVFGFISLLSCRKFDVCISFKLLPCFLEYLQVLTRVSETSSISEFGCLKLLGALPRISAPCMISVSAEICTDEMFLFF